MRARCRQFVLFRLRPLLCFSIGILGVLSSAPFSLLFISAAKTGFSVPPRGTAFVTSGSIKIKPLCPRPSSSTTWVRQSHKFVQSLGELPCNQRFSRGHLFSQLQENDNGSNARIGSNGPVGKEWDLKVAIIGAGPSGLLLAHRLLNSCLPLANIDVFESRSDPRSKSSVLGGRAYALGLGIRGRTAISTVDEELWETVKQRGLECERFRLHWNSKWSIKLRDGNGGGTRRTKEKLQPSVLIYQSDICVALLDELDRRAVLASTDVNVYFLSNITHVDLLTSIITMRDYQSPSDSSEANPQLKKGPYDLIIGCDGVRSIVRNALQNYSPPNTFQFTQRELLPGCYKVARVPEMPPKLDPSSVALILPERKTTISAFVEPTADGASILFAGRLSSSSETEENKKNVKDEELGLNSLLFCNPLTEKQSQVDNTLPIQKAIVEQFPLLEGTPGMDDAIRQLLSQRTNVASSIKCNTYHSPSTISPAALCGDAAHATGGVSGQGCNSALMDATVLVDCLLEHYKPGGHTTGAQIQKLKGDMLYQSLLSYSRNQVPEGWALYDLSFGNDGKSVPLSKKVRSAFSTVVDTLFGGKWGIGKERVQTLLSSSLIPFSQIRREREGNYVENFPSEEWFLDQLENVYR